MSVDLRVDWCSYEAAKWAVEHWHYSRKIPIGKVMRVGAWEDGVFVGAIVFSPGASPELGSPYGLGKYEVCELTRIALTNHKAYVSQIGAKAIELVRKASPSLKLVVSFADPFQSHHGGIYQAMNWIYAGTTSPSKQFFYGGKWTHSKTFRSEWSNLYHVDVSLLPSRDVPGKHRYLYPLDRAMRKQIAPLALPYPKRETSGPSVDGDTPVPTGRAGSTPAARS